MKKNLVQLSKFLSLVLRHRPGLIGLELDEAGWAEVADVLRGAEEQGHAMDRATLEEIVASSDKQRFALSADGTRIRANQGHSVPVELGLRATAPPKRLFHGTVAAALDAIRRDGLQKRTRHHVHLSPDLDTATKVGQRRGAAVILEVDAEGMAEAGHEFFVSENGVWLTERVPPAFIRFPGDLARPEA